MLDDIILLAVCLSLLMGWIFTYDRDHKAFANEREKWSKERKDLMDRIQAPSFAEYSNKVIKEKKAEQPQEELKPIEFIS